MVEFIRSALQALPSVATSPLALVAYLLVVAAWLIIALRVKRNKQLLKHLKDLPAKDRLQALRDEMGTIPLKEGFTPEQYLRSRRHLYYFVGFGMVCLLILIIFVVSAILAKEKEGTAAVDITLFQEEPNSDQGQTKSEVRAKEETGTKIEAKPSDKIRVGVTSHLRKDAQNHSSKRPFKLNEVKYTYERVGDKVVIKPVVPYLSILRSGGPIDGSESLFRKVYPKLSIKVVNNTKETIYLTEVAVNIRSSTTDKEPVIGVGSEGWDDLRIYNEGWGNLINPKLTFGTTDANSCKKLDPRSRPLKHSINLKTFSDSVDISMKPYVYVPPREERKGNWVTIRLYPNTHACIYGKIEYTTEDSSERTVAFKTTLWVGEKGEVPRFGVTMGASAEYKLSLEVGLPVKAEEPGYTKRIPISHYIKPSDVDHFTILVVTDKSAMLNLSFDFLTADGKVLHSKNVILNTFISRFWDEYKVEEVRVIK
jgi:hypothetical protein